MDASPLQVTTLPPPLPYYFNSLPSLTVFPFLSWVGRGIVRGDCFAQTQTSQPGVQSANKRPLHLSNKKNQQQQLRFYWSLNWVIIP